MHLELNERIKKLENTFQIQITSPEIFEIALTHGSYTRENELNVLKNYERLEFLGDAVLKLCVSENLYKRYINYPEGELTKIRSIIVSDNTIAEISKKIGLNGLIILGKLEEKSGGRQRKSILACAFEAVLGAYYLSGNFKEISNFLEIIFEPYIEEVNSNFEKYNAKTALQEYTQSMNKQLPEYKTVEEKGPEHKKIFVVEVSYKGDILAQGEGTTKRAAEQEAAYKACINLGVIQ